MNDISPTPPLLKDDAATTKQDEITRNTTGASLKQYIERVERLEEQKKGISSDIRDVFAEAKSGGFQVKIMRALLKERKKNPQERTEEAELLELYKSAIGME